MTEIEQNRIIDGNINELLYKKKTCDERLFVQYRDKMSLLSDVPYEKLPEIFSIITQRLSTEEKRTCARLLCDSVYGRYGDIGLFLPDREEKKEKAVIVYLDSPASRESLAEFEKMFGECRKIPLFDFNSVCEAVYNGNADMCVLPTENSTDGRLSGFYSLTVKYELFTLAVCDVTNYETSVRTRFSLLSSAGADYTESDELSCIVQFDLNKEMTLYSAVSAADYFGLYCSRADCIPESHIIGDFKGVFVFEGKRKEIFSFLFYMYVTSAPYTLQGIYDKTQR